MRLIDAEALCAYANNQKEKTIDANDIMRFPTVDAEPVVRCGDCKYFQCNVPPDGYLPIGADEYDCRYWGKLCDPDDFCSRGERKDEKNGN